MHDIKELTDMTSDLIDKYTMPEEVEKHFELLLREIIKRETPAKEGAK